MYRFSRSLRSPVLITKAVAIIIYAKKMIDLRLAIFLDRSWKATGVATKNDTPASVKNKDDFSGSILYSS